MKKVIMVLLCVVTTSLYAQDTLEFNRKIFDWKIRLQEVKKIDTEILEALPWTYEEYRKLWGVGGPLASDPSMIFYLYNSDFIDYTLFLRKLVSISVGAEWEADHVNYLLITLRKVLSNNWNQILPIISELGYSNTQLFWRFIFSGPGTPNYEQFKLSLLKKANQSNYKYVDEISDAYNYNLKLGEILYAH